MGFCTISELQNGIQRTLGFKIVPRCAGYCTDDDDFDYDGGGGDETTMTQSRSVWYTCKCNFTYCHKKSTAFPVRIFMKFTNAHSIMCGIVIHNFTQVR